MDSFSKTIIFPLMDLLSALETGSYDWLLQLPGQEEVTISWISSPPEQTHSGDLVLLESSNDISRQTALAQEAGAAAIAIAGPVDREAFRQISIPVVHLAAEWELPNAQRLLLQALFSLRALSLERGAQIQTRLTQVAARNEGLAGLAAAMREISQHSIVIQDKRLQPLASSPASPLRPVWPDLLEQLAAFANLPESLRDRRQAGETPILARDTLPGALDRLITPIVAGDVARGYLSILAPAGELDSTDRLVAEQGAQACAIEMAHAKAVRETEKRLHGDLLSALLHQKLATRDARLWAENAGLNLAADHAALRLAWDGARLSLRRLETLVNGEVARRQTRAIVSSFSGEVICFCETPRVSGRPAAALAMAQAVLGRAHEESPDAIVRCGIGTPAADLGQWHVSFRQAGQALEMTRRLNERAPLYYMDLSVYRLLLQFEDHPDLRAFLNETLGALLANENAEEWLSTLEEFFACNGNLSQTADALVIHRNTLTYRMDRIEAVSGLDLKNPDTRLAAQLALRIHRMLKTTNLPAG
jgi:PucR family transcriptional regulator, purine catabolism regulatory protein